MPMQRYPDYVCDSCVEEARDENGHSVMFANNDISGGLVGYQRVVSSNSWVEDEGLSDQSTVLIRGVPCYAAEAHFGGVVVRPK
jgi:hypothetical protein